MEFFQWGADPWGQQVLVRISWSLLYVAFWVGVAFVVFHLAYMAVWAPRLRGAGASSGEVNQPLVHIPERITRHSLAARLFHWVMAAALFVLLVTGFFPIVGIQFPWVTIHWIAGVVLTLSILYHIVHATFFLDFWSIWIYPSEVREAWLRAKRQLGQPAPGLRKHGKYPLDHKLYHLAVLVVGVVVIATGLFMIVRVETPLWTRDPYLFTDQTWGLVYVLHDLGAVLFVTLTMTHIYFAVRPDKLWLTKGMIWGWIDRKHFIEHHDPQRWVISESSKR
jgi:cytochrome b subunit of formate dehydrogenase